MRHTLDASKWIGLRLGISKTGESFGYISTFRGKNRIGHFEEPKYGIEQPSQILSFAYFEHGPDLWMAV